MYPFSVTLFSLLVLSHALTISLAEKYANASQSQPLQFASPKEGSTKHKRDQHKETEDQHTQPGNRHEVAYRSKRDSAEVEDEFNTDKRLRDFVGKRSQPKMYSSIPEPRMVTPVDISYDGDYNLESVIFPTDNSAYDYDVDGTDNMNTDYKQQFVDDRNKRLKDFLGSGSPGTESWDSRGKIREIVGKRSINNDDLKVLVDKRLRDFVGKRSDTAYGGDILNEKRLREFVGKRNGHADIDDRVFSNGERHFIGRTDKYDDNVDKRAREFLGKRHEIEGYDDVEKRLREFVGKRAMSGWETPSMGFEKRSREYVGKDYGPGILRGDQRPGEFLFERDTPEIFYENKRIREFIGKREDKRPRQFIGKREEKRPRQFIGKREEKRPRQFIGKREEKRPRQFIGKREEKRPRQFIGKREEKRPRQFIGKHEDKRPRQFIGKRSMLLDGREEKIELAKKLRDFVGKRSEDEIYQEDKRLRDFIGKRSEFITDSMGMSALKRLRDFVGKRDYVHELDTREIAKQVREIVGKR